MEEDKDIGLDPPSSAGTRLERLHFERELRSLELKAYSGVLEALRAGGKPNPEKEGVIKTLRDYFHVSDDRHKAELRLHAYDDKLSLISEKLSGYHFTEEWAGQAQKMYVPLGPNAFSLYRGYPSNSLVTSLSVRDPLPKVKEEFKLVDDSDDVDSESESELVENILKTYSTENGWQTDKPKPVTIAVEYGTGNEREIEEIEQQMKKRLKSQVKKQSPSKSPDITDAPNTPTKSSNFKPVEKRMNSTRSRGMKRKNLEEVIPVQPANQPIIARKKFPLKSKSIVKIKKPNAPRPKIKIPRRSESKRVKESSEETSSADEGENGPLPLEESSRVMSPVFSEVIRSSVMNRGRGGRNFRGRGSLDKRRNNMPTSPSKSKAGKIRPRTPNQKSAKIKNSIPTSGSRRKSKLNEKLDYDDVLMDLGNNDVEKERSSPYNMNDDKRLLDAQDLMKFGESRPLKDYKMTEECVTYTESLPMNYNFNHEDMEQVTDGVFKRPLPPSRGPKPWELQDAARANIEAISDENYSTVLNYGESGTGPPLAEPSQQASSAMNDFVNSPSTPPKSGEHTPPHKRQRIKSPIVVNPNIAPSPNASKVPLPAPVFSTSLNSVNKKRPKPISVVDSLNLHLPTSATASSLAASSNNRRPGVTAGGGCSMFSNSSALIAGARGTAPGILQQQRKAQPHILANSKVHQRTFLPPTNSSISNSVSNNIMPIGSAPVTLACASSAVSPNTVPPAQTVQIPTSAIPISTIPSVATSPIPFQNFPTATSPGLNISAAAVPIGSVSRPTPGTNIIFVQKANGPTVSGPATAVSSNVIPLKTSPRAVILRRTQLPRQGQGNVMILDMQKNQLVGPGQVPPFLQTARILNAPGELSLLNVQPNTSPQKNSSPPILTTPSSPFSPLQSASPSIHFTSHDSGDERVCSQESFITTIADSVQLSSISTQAVHSVSTSECQIVGNELHPSTISSTMVHPDEAPPDAQYAQIEAELMQMEQGNFEDVVYEEEVTTEIVPFNEAENHTYIYSSDACPSATEEVIMSTQESSSSHHNASSASGSSTDTASENETSLNSIGSPDDDSNRQTTAITKVSLSPMGEAKIASEAISRALSLSKGPTTIKRLTFTGPVPTGIPGYAVGKVVGSSSSSSDSVVARSLANDLPIIFQATAASLKSAGIVIEEGSSTNICLGTLPEALGVDVALHSNKSVQEQSQAHLQGKTSTC